MPPPTDLEVRGLSVDVRALASTTDVQSTWSAGTDKPHTLFPFPGDSIHDFFAGGASHKLRVDAQTKEVFVDCPELATLDTPPDRGLRAWMTVVGCALIQFCTFGRVIRFFVQALVKRLINFDETDTQILLVSIKVSPFALFNFTLDEQTATVIRLLCANLSKWLHAQRNRVFLTHGIGMGLACGLTYIPSLTVVSQHFQKRRTLAMGVVAAGSALGAVCHPILLNNLFKMPAIGFHNGVRISAGTNALLLVVANLIVRERRASKKKAAHINVFEFFSDAPYVLACVSGMLLFLGFFYPVFYLQLHAVSQGVDSDLAFYAISILNGASIFGRIIPAAFSHKLGPFNLLVFFALCLGVLECCMFKMQDLAGTLVFAVVFGFLNGGAIGMLPPVIAALSRDMSEIGARMGIDFFFCGEFSSSAVETALGCVVNFVGLGFVGLFAGPISGALLTQKYDQWLRTSVFCGSAVILAALVFVVARGLVIKRLGRSQLSII
ncbi:MFS general substrate transporter [Fistulina hepatica ATCC 64428]|nr:MFS general substrate transporter [Fistulina hepatica ATCC 64428]